MNPKVTVIITTYQGDQKLLRAVESVIKQTYTNIEIIVVDDNGKGTEKQKMTAQMLSEFIVNNKIKYLVHKTNMNGSAARNTGLRNSTGEYIAFLDDDDVFYPTRIQKCVEAIEKNPQKINAVYTGVVVIAENRCIEKFVPRKKGNLKREILISHGAIGSGSNIFIKKSIIDKVGEFDTEFKRYQDVEFMVRVSDEIYIQPIEEILIIKDNGIVRFLPNYYGLKEAQRLFFNKFHETISQSKYRDHIYYNKCSELVKYAYKFCHSSEIKDAWKFYFNYLPKDKKNIKLFIKGNLLRFNKTSIYKKIKYLKDQKIDKKIQTSMTNTELIFLRSNLEK